MAFQQKQTDFDEITVLGVFFLFFKGTMKNSFYFILENAECKMQNTHMDVL